MERRGEPRFPVSCPIRVIVPGDGARTIDSTLIDISATGVRFLSTEALDSENLVAVEVDSRLILAEVRYSQPRGDRYVIGARRLHEIAKDAQLSDGPAVVAEMLGHLRRHITSGEQGSSQDMAMAALERIVERREHPVQPVELPVIETLEPEIQAEPEPVAAVAAEPFVPQAVEPDPLEAARETLLHESAAQTFEPEPEVQEAPQMETAVPEPFVPQAVESDPLEAARETAWHDSAAQTFEPEPEVQEAPQAETAVPEPFVPQAVESDPLEAARETLLHDSAAQTFEPEPEIQEAPQAQTAAPEPFLLRPSQPPPAVESDPLEAARKALVLDSAAQTFESDATSEGNQLRFVLAVAAGLIIAAAIVMFFIQRQSEAQPAQSAPPAALTSDRSPSPVLHHVQIRVLRAMTASLVIDNGAPVDVPFQPNQPGNFDFYDHVLLKVSDGSAIQLDIDRSSVGALRTGPQTLRITAGGVQLVN